MSSFCMSPALRQTYLAAPRRVPSSWAPYLGRDRERGARRRHAIRMTRHARLDPLEVLARPGDRPLEPVAQPNLGAEAELALGLRRIAVALAGVVPLARRRERDRRRVAGELVDRLGELADRRLHAGGEVVDLAGPAAQRAGLEPARHVLDMDQVAARDAAVLHRQGLVLERLVDEGGGHVPPHGVDGATPATGAEHLAGPVDVLEAGLDEGHAETAPVVVAVQLAD